MKLMSFRRPDGAASWGIAKDDGVIDLGDRPPSLRHALWAMNALTEESRRDPYLRLTDISFLPAIPDPAKIICVGLNYKSHILEGGRGVPTKPVIFSRFPNIAPARTSSARFWCSASICC